MKTFATTLLFALASALTISTIAQSQEEPPPWAYPVNPPDFKLPPDDGTVRRVPDSTVTLTLPQVRDRFFAPDWHPGDYPPLPEIVARGRKPDVFACGFCHRADGPGGPEKMRKYPDCRRATSSSRWLPTSRAVRGRVRCKKGGYPLSSRRCWSRQLLMLRWKLRPHIFRL